MSNKVVKLILLTIVVIAFALRFWHLGSIPQSINWDEAAWGYNAYSLVTDAKDEFGVFLPYKYIESFGDFKPPVYMYLDSVPVKILGLNYFSTRFPSAFFGSLTVILTYLLVLEIFPRSKEREKIGLFSSFLLAVSPWHIMLSRAAFEANVSSFFIVLGIFSFLRAINKNMWYLLLSAVSFSITFYIFNSSRVFVPLMVIALGLIFWRKLYSSKKQTIISMLVGLIIILPIVPFLMSPQAKLRFQEVNIFSNIDLIKNSNQEIQNDNGAIWSKVIHNRRIEYGLDFMSHYFDNFNPAFLFIKGDGNQKFSTKDLGQMYFVELPFLIAGFILLFRRREGYYFILPIWLLLGIIPAAVARETPHALRTEVILPVPQIIVAIGIVALLAYISQRYGQKKALITLGFISILSFLSVFYFLHSYFITYPKESAGEWNKGNEEAFYYLKSVENNYDRINFTQEYGRPYIYYLFANKTNPAYFRQNSTVTRDIFGFVNVERVGKYYFTDSDTKDSSGKKIIYVRKPKYTPQGVKILKKFETSDGYVMLQAYVKD
jgi:4-amino-4-deoxy-L-arabinose transferase-like glycosyltransferase